MSAPDDTPRFEQISWEEVGQSRRFRSTERLVLLGGLVVVAALFWYDSTVAHVYLVQSWKVTPVEWVSFVALVVLLAYGVVPAVGRRESVKDVYGEICARPSAWLAGLFLVTIGLVGLFGPVLFGRPEVRFQYAFQPPLGISSGATPFECVGAVTGSAFDQRCHGSPWIPLGTNHRGHPMSYLVASGARVALYVVVIIGAFVVPMAAAVGVVAGLRGGLVDDLLMASVDVQLSIPAIMVYFIGYVYWNPSLLLLLVAFGVFSWGGIARLVRSEALQRREDGHVVVARSQGASWSYIARRHVLPNVTNTLVPAVFHLLALLVLAEAGVAFLGFHEIDVYSWGSTISESLNAQVGGQMQTRADQPAYRIWWVSTFPALALTLTLLSFKLLGDALRDALDPRGET